MLVLRPRLVRCKLCFSLFRPNEGVDWVWVWILADATSTRSILTGFDMDARPILYMRPGRENTETSPRQIRHLIYHLYVCFFYFLFPLLGLSKRVY